MSAPFVPDSMLLSVYIKKVSRSLCPQTQNASPKNFPCHCETSDRCHWLWQSVPLWLCARVLRMTLLRCPKFLRCLTADAGNFDRGHSLTSLPLPPAALGSLPTTSALYHFIYSSMAWVFPCWDLGSGRFSCSRASGVWRPSWFQRRRMPFKYFQFMPCFFSTVFS